MASIPTPRAKESQHAAWLILEDPQHGDRKKLLLGSVVHWGSQHRPVDGYRPHWDDPALDDTAEHDNQKRKKRIVLQQTMNKLWQANAQGGEGEAEADKPMELNDLLNGHVAAKSANSMGKLLSFFQTFLHKRQNDELHIESGIVKLYTIDNPKSKLRDNLMACPPWREQLQKLVEDDESRPPRDHHLLVTGLMICEDMQVRWKMAAGHQFGAQAKVDGSAVLAALGGPSQLALAKKLDAMFNFDNAKVNGEYITATCRHSTIFAVQYHNLKLEFDTNPSLWQRLRGNHEQRVVKKAFLKGVARGYGIGGFAGDHDSADEQDDTQVDWFYTSKDQDASSGEVAMNGSAPNGAAGH